MFRPALALLTVAAVVSVSALGHAQAAPSADSLFNEGSALLKAGKVEEACGKLAESQSLEPAIGTLGLLAYCHEQSGKLATAMREYGEVAELAHLASQAAREKVAREKVAELSGRVTRLSVVLTDPPAGLEAHLNTRLLSASELGASTPVDPGTAELRIAAPGMEPWTQPLSIPADGSTLRLVVPRLTPVKAAAPEPVLAKPATAPPPEQDRFRRPAMWTSFGAGALGLVVGGAFGLSAMSAHADSNSHCEGNVCDQTGVDARSRALSRARVSTISFAAGAVLGATGLVLLLTDHSHDRAQQAALRAVPGGASLSWEGRF